MPNSSKDNPTLSTPNEEVDPTRLAQIKARYEEERKKRLRDDGNAQFIEVAKSAQYKRFVDDPWVDPAVVQPLRAKFINNRSEMLIIGAGWGGIQNAVRMIEAGIPAEDIRIIDPAG